MPPPAEGFASRFIVGPTLRTQPDRRLVSLVRDGYEVAFDEIVRRYAKPLGRYAASIVGGRSEDVTQDAFSKALVALRRDSAEIELRPWLYRIVRNTALNDLRDQPPTPEALAETIAGGRSAAEEVERREEITELVTRLRALPEPQRAAIVMRELEGLSHDEIAAALGLSGGAARQAIYRARHALRGGAAMFLPLPVLRFLLDHGTEMTAGASAGGAAAAAGVTAGGASAGGALKLGALAAVIATSVGGGIALHENRSAKDAASATHSTAGAGEPAALTPPSEGPGDASSSGEDQRGGGDGSGRGQGDDGREGGSQGEGNRRGESSGPGRRDEGARGSVPDPGRRGHGGHGHEGERHSGPRLGQPGPAPGPEPNGSHRGPGGGERSTSGGPRPGGGSGGHGSEGGLVPSEPLPTEDPSAPSSGSDSGSGGSGDGRSGEGESGDRSL